MSQNFKNHARWNPLNHLVASPIVGFYAAYTFIRVWQEPTNANAIAALWAVGVATGVWMSRSMALRVQNRLIRLEMRLRLREVLPPALAARVTELSVRQLIALRFASDAELPALVERTLNGEFPKPREIKRAVRDWQADYLRV
jgi:hypothetical protein